jgi:hypothetical protein
LSPDQVNPPRWQRFRIVTWGQRRRMTWLLVLLAWTVCAAVVAPFVGRVLAHGGVVERRPPDAPSSSTDAGAQLPLRVIPARARM